MNPAQRLQGKVSLITGAAQGIGLATALKFAREGAVVVICDIKQAGVDDAVKACEALGAKAAGYVLNVTDRAGIDLVVAKVKADFGRIDVLVNNAGITQDARLQKMTLEQFDRVIDVNLRGVFHCSQAVADVMVAQGSGVILNASSVVGIYGNFGQTNYAASKFGGIGVTQSLALEFAEQGIRINSICPGNLLDSPLWVDSLFKQYAANQGITEAEVRQKYIDQVPMKRACQYRDVTNVVIFLASDDSSYLTGQAINVTGGQEMR